MLIDTANWFGLYSESEEGGDALSAEVFADEHSLNDQRFYNILCWVYGSDTEGYKHLVDDEVLPEERAEICPDECEQSVTSWLKLLDPNLKD